MNATEMDESFLGRNRCGSEVDIEQINSKKRIKRLQGPVGVASLAL